MDNYQGDLTDIVRASGGSLGCGSGSPEVPAPTWPFTSDPINFSSSAADHRGGNCFGDPFIDMRDPLLHEVNMAGSGYFGSPNSAIDIISTGVEDTANRSFCGAGTDSILSQKMFEDDMKGPCNIFSRIQISQSPKQMAMSPCDSPVMAAPAAAATSPRGIKAPAGIPSDMISTNSSKGCLVDDTVPVQISSPRNLGIKRRKSQAKKVVCIPAPAAANSRSSGEVIPSDLWAWRKYGQKPIKGSPYPRGYYRCSSSKGCSARKQVERCKNDPSMLVITYTSEHNHPWPTQRNALAGSTRSQLSKNNAASKSSTSSQLPNPTNTKEEVKESSNDTLSPVVGASSSASQSVKEEIEEIEKQLEMDDAGFGEGSNQSYRPALPGSLQSEDFFADLDELDVDPLNLMFTQGFNEDQQKENKGLDPFSLFDWSGDNNNTSFGESNRVL